MKSLLKFVLVFSSVIFLMSCSKEEKELAIVEEIKSPTLGKSMQPYLFSDGKEVLMSWTQKINDSITTLNYAVLKDKAWSEPTEISKGDNWFVNWADFPAIAKNDKNILSHFLQKSDPATFAYDVKIKQSNDSGKNWSSDKKLHQDSTLTEHGFVTMIPYKEDSFFITWLDGRNTMGGGHGGGSNPNAAMNVRGAVVLKNGDVIDDTLVDGRTCDCCQTSAAITQNGPIIVYRDRSENEIRDIYISRLVDGNWTNPKAIYNDNWEIKGCPVNGPKAAALENTLAIAWFTAANNIPKVNLVFSDDNGENFSTPIQIDDGNPVGRVDVALLDKNTALVSWMETTETGADIKMIKVGKDGTKSESFIINSISESRSSGFPQFEILNDEIIAAWNHKIDGEPVIKTVRFSLEALN
ncbi:MAG: hypothetical protein COB73_07835 [Flavobacteriaceae bacterium]|nr:MAG: hypothetical protein COB73_07835 [Flavobacteriaceae bacterium]